MYKDAVSTEPLDVIRLNECETDLQSLATRRFRALWNEIARLSARPTEEEVAQLIYKYYRYMSSGSSWQKWVGIARAVLAMFPKVQP